MEISGTTAAVKIHGFKAEGNYVQIWVRNAASFWLQGYGGNASPFPFKCPYPSGYAPYQPSLLRFENVTQLLVANVITQDSGGKGGGKCGIFNTGFSGTMYDPKYWRSILELSGGANYSTPALQWPVLYMRGRS